MRQCYDDDTDHDHVCTHRDDMSVVGQLVGSSAGVGSQVLRGQSVDSQSGGGEAIRAWARVDGHTLLIVRFLEHSSMRDLL